MQDKTLGSEGSLRVHLAATAEEVCAAQKLRYRIFYDEMGAQPSDETIACGRDVDRYDMACDHLLVSDLATDGRGPRVVGTYRMLRRAAAERSGGFYSEDEYDLRPLLDYPGEILEVGRSCVDLSYRSRAVMQLLWQGIASYVSRHNIGLLFGCASLPGTDPASMKRALAYLHHHYLAPSQIRPRALAHRYVPMAVLPGDAIDAAAAWRELPPLIRGYLRLGGRIGDGAVVDEHFNTTDVCLVLETEHVTARYLRHYQLQAEQPAA
jgi:L-ornithine Nalpha-acyltransferase